jgi:hypothetical protein
VGFKARKTVGLCRGVGGDEATRGTIPDWLHLDDGRGDIICFNIPDDFLPHKKSGLYRFYKKKTPWL